MKRNGQNWSSHKSSMLHTYWKYPKHYWSAFEEESSVCSICSPIFLPTFTATFSISWAKSRLDGSQEEQNGMETIWGEAGEGETF